MLAAFATFVGVVVLILLDGGAASQDASSALSARSTSPRSGEVEDRRYQHPDSLWEANTGWAPCRECRRERKTRADAREVFHSYLVARWADARLRT